MASLRRVKVLLVLNLIAVAGFVLFLAKCRPVTAKSGDSFHDVHPRAEVVNLTARGISSIQDAVLKRLSLLEDIVYRQLNGKNCSVRITLGYGRGAPSERGDFVKFWWWSHAPFISYMGSQLTGVASDFQVVLVLMAWSTWHRVRGRHSSVTLPSGLGCRLGDHSILVSASREKDVLWPSRAARIIDQGMA